jgi:hypothetical protein
VTSNEIYDLQKQLNAVGMSLLVLGELLKEDGIYGPNTKAVYKAWLDRDSVMPSVTPEAAKPWWQSRAIIGLFAAVLAGAAHAMGLEIGSDEITAILLSLVEFVGLGLAMWGTIRRQAPIDPTLVARLPGRGDVRLPMRPERQTPGGPGRTDPRGHFGTD